MRKYFLLEQKKKTREIFQTNAEKSSQPYVVHRWLGGMLTNNETIKSSVSRMRDLKQMDDDGSLSKLPKKEVSSIKRELYKLEKNLTGISDMEKKPKNCLLLILRHKILLLQS